MKRLSLFLTMALLICSCVDEQKRKEAICLEFLNRHIPAQVSVLSVSDFDTHKYNYQTITELVFSFKSPEGFEGTGTMDVNWSYDKKSIESYYQPYIRMEQPDFVPKNNIWSCNHEKAYGADKMVATVMIPERYSQEDLEMVSKYVIYLNGQFVTDWWISYFIDGMSRNGPHYALVKAHRFSSGITFSTEFNKLTEITNSDDLSAAYHKLDMDDTVAYIIECYQFIGNSFQVVYAAEDENYYIMNYADGKFMKPDRIKMIDDVTFKYEEDTGETFKMKPDGLYCYFEGNLAAVYNKMNL